ncbi:MAG TPA: TlpA disulfide reductase family protein [Dissulfurispiraceae bacterium]|nr:TlpA disulfide reductase family protein [Dissulfurispiraceae bacterium]
MNQPGHLFRLVLVFLSLVIFACSGKEDTAPQGGAVPQLWEITLPDLEGNPVSFGALKGKIIVLDFFASWCGPCKETAPLVERAYERNRSDKVAFVGVSLDQPGSSRAVKTFVEKNGTAFPVVIDDGRLRELTGIFSVPTVLVVAPSGEIRTRFPGARRDLHERITKEIEGLLR